ncbi:MAG: Mrp/NBP35 family ATP-binding protein [Lentisphaeria bacterium]
MDKHCTSCNKADCAAKHGPPGETADEALGRQQLAANLCGVRHTLLVMSGKGGVGKSTVAVNLAVALATEGRGVGLLDVDFHGPSVPVMLGLESQPPMMNGDRIVPITVGPLKVMTLGCFLDQPDTPVIWRGPMKIGAIRQLLGDVEWGELDYLIIDAPPGTGDEPLTVCQMVPNLTGAVIVTTPQKVALADVSRSLAFCRELKVPVLGVVENMSGWACPKCGEVTDVFTTGGGEQLARQTGVPFLGRIPLDPGIVASGDAGQPFAHFRRDTPSGKAFLGVADTLQDGLGKH